MMHALVVIAWLIALAWVFKFAETAAGFPRVPDLNRPQYDTAPAGAPKVVAIVPARNEAPNIAACLSSLLGQDYANLQIIAINDRSTDETGLRMDEIARSAPGRLRMLHITELPDGWLGKTHAMAMSAREAIERLGAEYLLFTDGDVRFAPSVIRKSLAYTQAAAADHFVLMPTMLAQTIREGAVLSYLQTMSLWAVRPWLVSDPRAKRAALGVGAFNLVRVAAYRQIGGFDATPMEVLEDLYLGRRIKWAGLRQAVAIAPGVVEVHWAAGARGIAHNMTKNIFAVFRFRPFLLLAAAASVALSSIGPAVFAILPATRLAGCITLFAAGGLYWVSSKINRISAAYVVFLPVAAALVVYAMVRSMMVTLRDGGITWRGTFYDLATLRRHMVVPPRRQTGPDAAEIR
jgi:glycosyltransferase involved in cell wall biosynthesis